MILEKLKVETLDIHRKVEKDNLAKYIMDESITLKQYETLLRKNFRVYKAVEDFINANYAILPTELAPFASYDKTNALAKDIQVLSKLPLPQPLKIAHPRDLATLIGMLYVIEGSMVGGMMMSKKIKSCSSLSGIQEHHFFNSNAKVSSSRWKKFKNAVSSLNFSKAEVTLAIDSSISTFALFEEAYKGD